MKTKLVIRNTLLILVATAIWVAIIGMAVWTVTAPSQGTSKNPPKLRQCDVCDDYKSKKETLKEQFRALEETHNSLDLQAEKEGILNPAPPPPGEHIDSSAPGRAGHIGTMIYWDKKGKLSYVELDLQRLRLTLSTDSLNHAILHAAERLESK